MALGTVIINGPLIITIGFFLIIYGLMDRRVCMCYSNEFCAMLERVSLGLRTKGSKGSKAGRKYPSLSGKKMIIKGPLKS